jgi:hypothetical protein
MFVSENIHTKITSGESCSDQYVLSPARANRATDGSKFLPQTQLDTVVSTADVRPNAVDSV